MKHTSEGLYGSREWMEAQYAGSVDDPWGLAWRGSQQYRYQTMFESLRLHLPACAPDLSIVDIGCATGIFTSMLRRIGDGNIVKVTGIDIAELAVQRARIRFPDMAFECMDLGACAKRYSGSCDIVTCMEVIYYLPVPERKEAVRQLKCMLKPGGLLLISSMIASSPYFTLASLTTLVGAEIPLLETGVLYLKPLVLWEKLLMRSGRLLREFSAAPNAAVIDRFGRFAPALTGSHAFVVAQNT